MAVTEGAVITGCGYQKDIGALALDSDDYPSIRVRLRGRGTTPQYKIEVVYTDATSNDTGWVDAPTSFTAITMQLTAGKVVDIVRLYARCNTALGSAEIDYDYSIIQSQYPIIPHEHFETEIDLKHTLSNSSFRLKCWHDKLAGITAFRYRFDENAGLYAYDLSVNKRHGTLTNTPTWTAGKFNYALQFASATSERVDTGYKPTIAATGAITIAMWLKAAPGATGVLIGSGKAPMGVFNRVQLDFPGADKIRVYAKDDAANEREYTSTAVVCDSTWHHIVAVVSPNDDLVSIYVDGELDGSTAGVLGVTTLDTFDFTIGCLHNEGGYSSYADATLDEVAIYERALVLAQIEELYRIDPYSGISRVPAGSIIMFYVAAQSESLVEKLLTGRIIDKETGGEPDSPTIEFVGGDWSEILHDREWSRTFGSATQISAVVDYVIDDEADEFYKDTDTTNRTLTNVFKNEEAWAVLQKLSEIATFATGEVGAHFFIDPGGCFRWKKHGAFASSEHITDGSDGNTPNIMSIKVKESIKSDPSLANDVKVVIFEAVYIPSDQDAWTESADGWDSPDPLDAGYPQSDAGDKTTGTASVAFNVTAAGAALRMRLTISEVDINNFDELRFDIKYGALLTVDDFDVKILKLGSWSSGDYRQETGIAAPGAAAWAELVIDLTTIAVTGNPGTTVSGIEINVNGAGGIGTGGFRIDNLRFIRTEKYGSDTDATSQANYGRRSLTLIDKSIAGTTLATYVAGNIVDNRKYPIVTAKAIVPGLAQTGYRPPQTIEVSSLKDGLYDKDFQIVRARHLITVKEGYTCEIDLIAAKTDFTTMTLDPKINPALLALETIQTEQRKWLKITQQSTLVGQYIG